LAFTKEEKAAMVARYGDWLKQSQAVFMLEFSGMTMKDVEELRRKVRDAGGEFHIVKNKLLGIALDGAGMPRVDEYLDRTSAVGFAFHDAPAMAKILSDAAKTSEIFKLKGGYLEKQAISAAEIKSLADLPPLPQMRSRLLGVLLAPAGQFVRTLAEPARSMAGVLKAFSEKSPAPAAG
jgi:large subunit ribosomal protein L10